MKLLLPMYNMHSYYSLKHLGKNVLYMAKYGTNLGQHRHKMTLRPMGKNGIKKKNIKRRIPALCGLVEKEDKEDKGTTAGEWVCQKSP